jgi:uncharacterized radical SAM superfamily Fe-S cluster-containing enzyme
LERIDAEIILDDANEHIILSKKCPNHGFFEDILSRDPEEYLWNSGYSEKINSRSNISTKPINLIRKNENGCPNSCGICDEHLTTPCIALIDLTNRCNLKCPVCFANSAAKGFVFEPSIEEIYQIMDHFRAIRPIPAAMLQLSGGEPTLRKDLFDIIKYGKQIGFQHIMLTTNGVKLAESVEYCKNLIRAGLDAVYLSFDGIEPDTYKKLRGSDLSKLKFQVLKNCRKAKMDAVVLVPTIIKGVNDHEIGNIMNTIIEYNDVISTVVYQPVSLTGRISMEELPNLRYTTSDLKKTLSEVTNGQIKKFYPLAMTAKLIQLMPWFDNAERFILLSHDECGFATFGILSDTNHWQSLDSFLDVEGLVMFSNNLFDIAKKGGFPYPFQIFGFNLSKLPKFIRKMLYKFGLFSDYIYKHVMKLYFLAGASKFYTGGVQFALRNKKLLFSTLKLILRPGLQSMKKFMRRRNIMIGSMHFQDAYNFDLDRVRSCVVHYGVIDPDDSTKVKQIPFCAMNTIHRDTIERALADRDEKKQNIQEIISQW